MARSLVLSVLATSGLASPLLQVSVSCSTKDTCQLGAWQEKSWLARAAFRPSQNETGWATVFVESAKGAEDELAAVAAGFAEGYLTGQMIWDSYQTYSMSGLEPTRDVQEFIREQVAFMNSGVASGQQGSYWPSVGLVLLQLQGLHAGYTLLHQQSNGTLPGLTLEQIMWLNIYPEMDDIQSGISPSSRRNFAAMGRKDFFNYVRESTHCSALFRVTPELDDLIAAHTTWSNYIWMLRVFKAYKLPFKASKAETLFFSGFPGVLASQDDFVVTSEKLVIIETTNDVFNNSLYDFVTTSTVPYWVRVIVASRTATGSKDWHDIFYQYNSGTYNNQWMVADYKKFQPRTPLPPWTFAVSEQIPGPYYHPGEDMTDVLQRGHWPSYNVPFFEDVYNISGYPEMVKQQGYGTSYQLAPRAPIFRRDADKVNSLQGMQHFIRENNWGTDDPLAKTPCSAIACRHDLDPSDPSTSGGVDAKIVTKAMVDALAASIICGPTTQGQPPFAFVGQWADVPHVGMPTTFDFEWQTVGISSMTADGADHQSAAAAVELVV